MLATLHVGVEPATLALLAATGAMPPAAAGWVVGMGQVGMGLGALICWRWRRTVGRPAALVAATAGMMASGGLAFSSGIVATLAARGLLGVGMGFLLACATAAAARSRPHRAIGTILLGQQLLATATMLALPAIAVATDARAALAALTLIPFACGLLVNGAVERTDAAPHDRTDCRRQSVAPLITMAMLIGVVLMIWSYIGEIGRGLGIASGTASIAVALTSLASAPAAIFATLMPPRQSRPMTALTCGLGLLVPLLLPAGSGLGAYVAAMVMFNAASAFATIRFSAWAMEASDGPGGRRAVIVVQSLAMAGGSPVAAAALALGGMAGLTAVASLLTAAAVLLSIDWRGLARRQLPILALRHQGI
jgi:predicted MFS family arabinose efflux permease